MQHVKSNDRYIIKLERGEPVIETLTSFCSAEKIQNASFSGIGAVEYVRCGYYALDEQKYYFTEYPSLVEVASMTGNVMLKDNKPFVHVHGVFTDTDNRAFGGHIDEARVGVTLEIILTPFATSLERHHDSEIGLFLIHCPS